MKRFDDVEKYIKAFGDDGDYTGDDGEYDDGDYGELC